MKPTITFDKSAAKFVLESLGKIIDKKGYIRGLKWMGTKKPMKATKEKCGICKKDIHIEHFAGIMNGIGLVCNDIACLVALASHIKSKKATNKRANG